MTTALAPDTLSRANLAPSRLLAGELSRAESASENPDFRRILNAASNLLGQGELLLGAISLETYTTKLPMAFNGSIGGHYRHCLDHFKSLLCGLESKTVDYDHRERDARLEGDPAVALIHTRHLRQALEDLTTSSLGAPVTTRCEVSYEHGDSPVTQSTLGRELVYAIAHGIHHYALISVMARLMNAELPPDFGIAPSTVRHQRTIADR